MGWFTKKEKTCSSRCRTDCETNVKTYCKLSKGDKATEKLESLKKEIEKLTKEEIVARHEADKSSTMEIKIDPPKVESKSDTYIYNLGAQKSSHTGGLRKRKTRKTRKRKSRKRKGGWLFSSTPKQEIQECNRKSLAVCQDSCEKICDNASIETADAKLKKAIEEGEKLKQELTDRIESYNRLARRLRTT